MPLYKGVVPSAATTSGSMVEGGIYKIATISGTSVFPEGFEVGDYFLGDATKALSAGNSAYLIAAEEAADVTEFSMEFSADEIEVTTLLMTLRNIVAVRLTFRVLSLVSTLFRK